MRNLKITFSNHQEFLIDYESLTDLIKDRFGIRIEGIKTNLLPLFVLDNFNWAELEPISKPITNSNFAYLLDFKVSAEIEVFTN